MAYPGSETSGVGLSTGTVPAGGLLGGTGGERAATREDVANTILRKMKKMSGWQ